MILSEGAADASKHVAVLKIYNILLIYIFIQADQKVSVHLMITIQSSGAQRLFDYPVYIYIYVVHLLVWITNSTRCTVRT